MNSTETSLQPYEDIMYPYRFGTDPTPNAAKAEATRRRFHTESSEES